MRDSELLKFKRCFWFVFKLHRIFTVYKKKKIFFTPESLTNTG